MKCEHYGNSLTVKDPLLIAYMRVRACRSVFEEMQMRKTSEGRKHLLVIAKERRKEPLALRRAPRMMGQMAAQSVNAIIYGLIKIHEITEGT